MKTEHLQFEKLINAYLSIVKLLIYNLINQRRPYVTKLGIQEFRGKYVLVPADKEQTMSSLFDGSII